MLPPPALVFTVPSIHDDTVLDCRIYNPPNFFISSTSLTSITWRKKAAIVAHPYALLGGCYDDHIVDIVASELLVDGFVVCTFNFRGASGSKGRTSWSSKPETKDYVSLVGFMIYFMHHSSMPKASKNVQSTENLITSSRPTSKDSLPSNEHTQNSNSSQPGPVLLLAGYSYGALITTQLPSPSDIYSFFAMPEIGTAAAEIRIRAQQLAKQQNTTFSSIMASAQARSEFASDAVQSYRRGRSLRDALNSQTHSTTSGIRVGGEETSPDIRRASHESSVCCPISEAPEQIRRSIDRVRYFGIHSKDHAHSKSSQYHASLSSEASTPVDGAASSPPLDVPSPEVPAFLGQPEKLPSLVLDGLQPAYLLISPLRGFITSLATMWTYPSSSSFFAPPLPKVKYNSQPEHAPQSHPPSIDHNLLTHPTLAVFGSHDIFTSNKKMRAWVSRLQRSANSRFRHVEVPGAGHFWTERGVVHSLQRAVRDFIRDL